MYFIIQKLVRLYLIEQTISGFLLAHNTITDQEDIYTADDTSMICMDGVYRSKFANGDSCYGTRVFDKSGSNGEEQNLWCLLKYANGNISYEEHIEVIGKDNDMQLVTIYSFDDTSLEWFKVV